MTEVIPTDTKAAYVSHGHDHDRGWAAKDWAAKADVDNSDRTRQLGNHLDAGRDRTEHALREEMRELRQKMEDQAVRSLQEHQKTRDLLRDQKEQDLRDRINRLVALVPDGRVIL
jgi:hypothetical protein